MLRLCLLFVLLFCCATPLLAQDIFPCRDSQGRLFVTDNPEALPIGCALLGSPPAGGSLNIVPQPDVPSPASRGAMTAVSRQAQQRLARESLWRARAEELLRDYQAGISGIYQAGRSQDRRDARQHLELIREKKRVLLAEVYREGRQPMRQELETRLRIIVD